MRHCKRACTRAATAIASVPQLDLTIREGSRTKLHGARCYRRHERDARRRRSGWQVGDAGPGSPSPGEVISSGLLCTEGHVYAIRFLGRHGAARPTTSKASQQLTLGVIAGASNVDVDDGDPVNESETRKKPRDGSEPVRGARRSNLGQCCVSARSW